MRLASSRLALLARRATNSSRCNDLLNRYPRERHYSREFLSGELIPLIRIRSREPFDHADADQFQAKDL